MKGRHFTLILPYYRNPSMLQAQIDRISRYPEDVLPFIRLIVVDDGSPKHAVQPPKMPPPFPYEIYRIEVDVRWNWLAARNIGVHHARTAWVLLTDIDHLMPVATAWRIAHGKLDANVIYRFSRRNYHDDSPYHPHPNSWLMTRSKFDETGGYDERFSGFYGTDGMFRDRCGAASLGGVVILKDHLERVDRSVMADASTTTYERKAPEDKEAVPRIRREIEASGDLRPKRLTFPYHRVYSSGE